MIFHQATTILSALAAASSMLFQPATAAEFADPGFTYGSGMSYGYGWNMTALEQSVGGDYTYIGGIRFSDNGNWVCAVRYAEYEEAGVYCNEVVRDTADGRVIEILPNADGLLSIVNMVNQTLSGSFLDYLDAGFQKGPGGYDYATLNTGEVGESEIGLFTWQFDATGRPSSLTLEYLMDFGSLTRPDYIMGLAFSNIVQDPNTGFGLLFTFLGSDGAPLTTLPLIENAQGFYDVDEANVRYLCTPNLKFSGSLDLIPIGNQANNYAVTNYETETLELLDIDPSTGFPSNNPNPVLLADLQTNISCPYVGTGLVNLNPGDPSTEDLPGNIWGSKFDIKGTGDYFAATWGGTSNSFMYVFHGFPPGYDVNVVSANLANVLDALLEDITATARKLTAEEEMPKRQTLSRGDRYQSSNKNVVRKTKKSSPCDIFASKSSKKENCEPSTSTSTTSTLTSTGTTGTSTSTTSTTTSTTTTTLSPGEQQTAAVVESLENFGVDVTDDRQAALATALNPAESPLIQDAIATGTTSQELLDQMNEIDQIVLSIMPSNPTTFQSESAGFIYCMTDKISNTATPSLVANDQCTLPSPA